MSLHIEENYANGIPQTAVDNFDPRGLQWHWTAGGTGRRGAESTIQHFVNTRWTVNASYHILLWWEAATKRTYAMWIVPSTKAAHSMNPGKAYVLRAGSAREKARIAEVKRILGPKAGDPNAGCIAVSFCGMPADLAAAMRDPVFVADVRELARQLIAHPKVIDRPHFGHGWVQPSTRYETDATVGGQDLLIAQLYGAAAAPGETGDMQFWKPVQEDWTAKVGARFWDGAGNEKKFVAAERVQSVAESSDGTYRLVKYPPTAPREILVMERAGLTPISGTRVPAPGSYGFPPPPAPVIKTVVKEVPTGITEAEVAAAADQAANAERERIAQSEAERIRTT